MNNNESPYIFYLCLEENLPKTFYIFNQHLKDLGYILIPVKVDQLQSLAASADQDHLIVISSVIDSRELKMFNERVRKFLKFILRSKRITFLQLSSFSKLNDTRAYSLTRNYFFLRYPLNAKILSGKIARYHLLKSGTSMVWPGGKRAGLGSLSL